MDETVDVEIRSVKDPYYVAAGIVLSEGGSGAGCVSGTSSTPYKMDDAFAPKADGKSFCFGATPGEKAATGLLFLVIGAIILAPICCVFCAVKMMGNKRAEKDPTRGWKNAADPAGSPSEVEMMA